MDNLKELLKITKELDLLYAEDDENARMEFSELLELLFNNVTTAVDGIDALEKFQKDQFDLIITDVSMPKMDGIKLLESIRSIDKEQKVIIMSAYSDTEHADKAKILNVDEFIFKPIDIATLSNALLNIFK